MADIESLVAFGRLGWRRCVKIVKVKYTAASAHVLSDGIIRVLRLREKDAGLQEEGEKENGFHIYEW